MATLMSYFAPPIAGEWGDEAEDSTDGVPVLRTTNFTADGRLSYDDLTYRSIDTEKKENKILQPGDIIIEKSGGTPKKPVGRCVYFDRDDDYDYFCSNFTAILRANTEDVNTKYLWYLLQEHYKTRQCLKYQYKTNGIANLDIKDYLSHKEVELPPREVQDKRVEAMDYSQYLLDLHQELLEIMDNAVKSRFVEMFGDFNIESPFPIEQLDCIADLVSGITKGRKTKETELREVPYMAVSNVKDGYIDWTTIKTIMATEKEIEQYRIQPNDILMTEGGDPDKVGRGALISEVPQDCIHQNHIFRVRLNKKVNPIYFEAYLQQPFTKRYFLKSAKQTTGIASINMTQLRNTPVVLPPIELQNQFADFVAQADKSKLTIKKSMDNLRELRDSLLQEYFG